MACNSTSLIWLKKVHGIRSLLSFLPDGVSPVRIVLMKSASVQSPSSPPGVKLGPGNGRIPECRRYWICGYLWRIIQARFTHKMQHHNSQKQCRQHNAGPFQYSFHYFLLLSFLQPVASYQAIQQMGEPKLPGRNLVKGGTDGRKHHPDRQAP